MPIKWAGMALLLVALLSCRGATAEPTIVSPPVSGLITELQDEVRDLPGDRIAWSTFWRLCWASYPGAEAYELMTLTGEGISPRLRRQSDRCFRIEAAAGQNEKAFGLAKRDVQLTLQAGQLAYRVRAVLSGSRVSEWSEAAPVGENQAVGTRTATATATEGRSR
ncbi:MAG: hypothetical protein HY329_13520 [Chloroflexi bacterium]|nr:hypothetical protein [Chloroflexota bacterium]